MACIKSTSRKRTTLPFALLSLLVVAMLFNTIEYYCVVGLAAFYFLSLLLDFLLPHSGDLDYKTARLVFLHIVAYALLALVLLCVVGLAQP